MKRTFLSPGRTLMAALAAFALVLMGQTQAQADTGSRDRGGVQTRGDVSVLGADDLFLEYYEGGWILGTGEFNADPENGVPGDAIRACDTHADGAGIDVQMDINPGSIWITDRLATTRGHNSPYCSPWMSGDIPEGTVVAVRICKASVACNAPQYSFA
ncbi:hypothetical protein CA850_13180 [Micromonospora echinospora]|uniref:Secreted protein n=1 Tax=Micromonospora echinospora TaxID=1877 RepID=A0A1C4YJC6_MICEC|nr:hypothetical protein [Micromonospora echinospora]OZV81085.1 hypothetical protein CA850_13180 [Micromonospora echinospora]SCF20824.1 hypothetical protein GA0070618_4045 [Micromonospora echinospora]